MGRGAGAAVLAASAAGVAGVLGAGAAPATGCYTHQCDGKAYSFAIAPDMQIADGVYDTIAGAEGHWLDYGPNTTVNVSYANIGPRQALPEVTVYTGTSADPNAPTQSWAPATGQLAVLSGASDTGVSITNMTCGGYFARFVLQFPTLAAGDAGADAPDDSPGD